MSFKGYTFAPEFDQRGPRVNLFLARRMLRSRLAVYGAVDLIMVERASQDPSFRYLINSNFEGDWKINGLNYSSRVALNFGPTPVTHREDSATKMDDLVRRILKAVSWRGKLVHAEALYSVLGCPLGDKNKDSGLFNFQDLNQLIRAV